RELGAKVWEHPGVHRGSVAITGVALCAHACGDLIRARELADEAVSTLKGWHKMWALNIRSYVAAAGGDNEQARRDVYQALAIAVDNQWRVGLPGSLEGLAGLAVDGGNHGDAARLL